MYDERPAVDEQGHPGYFRRSGGDGGCLMPLIVGAVILAIPVLIIAAIIAGIGSLFNSVGLATGAIKPTPTPTPVFSVTLPLDSAQHDGNFATNLFNTNSQYPNGLRSGASLTFNTDVPSSGSYTL